MRSTKVAAVTLGVAALVASACGSTVNRPVLTEVRGDGGGAVASGDLPGGPGSTGTTGPGGVTGPGATVPGGGPAPGGTGAAGGGTGGADGGGGPAGGGPGAGPAVTDPIQLGFVTTALSNAAAFGLSTGAQIPERDLIRTLVDAYNAAGGIAGRQITPVFADTDTGATSWDADFAAACSTFTEDNQVAAVLGYAFGVLDAFESCLAADGIPHLSGTYGITAGDLARYPLLFSLSMPTFERINAAKIDGAIAEGVLTPASRLGVVRDSCPRTTEAWEGGIRDHIESSGITLATVFELGCPRGSADAAAEAGRIGNLLLQFRSEDVDRIMFVASEGPALFIISNAAESQGYRPTYLVSSWAQTSVTSAQLPAAQAVNVRGYGWMPVNDTNRAQWPGTSAAADRCFGLLADRGLRPTSALDTYNALITCDALFLYEAALTATNGRSDGPSVAAAIEALGSGQVSAASLDGAWTFGPGRHDGPSVIRPFAFDGGCGCFTYRGPTTPIP